MIEKLEKIILHFEDLEKQMTDPNLINDQNKYKEITKEHRRLTPVVEKSRDYISIYNQITEDESILEGDDEELKKIVKDELEDLKNQASGIEDELKILLYLEIQMTIRILLLRYVQVLVVMKQLFLLPTFTDYTQGLLSAIIGNIK